VFVKICGITNEEDAHFAVAMGADALGFVFAPSPRQITVDRARDIVRRLAHGVVTIGVFRDEAPPRVAEIVNQIGLRGAQLHGHESPAEAAWVRQRVPFVVKAFAAGDPFFDRVDDFEVDAVLVDSATPGSGRVFDWTLTENLPLHRRVILAGGLTPDNVGEAIARLRPWGVDVSTGVEVAPGQKDAVKVMRFVNAAKEGQADEQPDGDALEIDLDGRPVLDLYDYDWEEDTSPR
jgi:phosphoribosylanthranilate isomerase